MRIIMTTDFMPGVDSSLRCESLKKIAAAGFDGVDWTAGWNLDYFYTAPEIAHIKACLADHGLTLGLLHGTNGQFQCWYSNVECLRSAGVLITENRIRMAAELDCDTVVMHTWCPEQFDDHALRMDMLRRSLDELEPVGRSCGVRLALENGFSGPHNNLAPLKEIIDQYPARSYVGLCWDSGHGNMHRGVDALAWLESMADRLIAIHLHDNDGTNDLHNLPGSGVGQWDRLIGILKAVDFSGPVNLECNMRKSGIDDPDVFAVLCLPGGPTDQRCPGLSGDESSLWTRS